MTEHHDMAKEALLPVADEELARLHDLALQVAKDESWTAEAREAVGLLWLYPLRSEWLDRRGAERNAEIVLEANGHEVWIAHDGVPADRGEPPWTVFCHCGNDVTDERGRSRFDTDQAARAAGDRHITEHGGRWES